ncbi:MAG: tetratricopeptide repeat protein [Bacteroidota bacterium]
MIKSFILIISTTMLLIACSGQDASDLMKQADDLGSKGKTAEALALYEQIAKDFADTPEAPDAMIHCARIYINEQKDPVKAATTYELVAEKYPQSEYGHRALFAAAYTYANDIGNLERGREAYEKYLKQYPDSSMASTAKFELDNLGKSPEELLESLQSEHSADVSGNQ